MQPDPWEVPDRRQVMRWRLGHELAICLLGGFVVGRFVPGLWLPLLILVVWGVVVVFAHDRLDRWYDRMREGVHDHAA